MTLRSEQFDDVYFSQEGPLAETRYVFLDHNHLTERFKDSENFTIVETGFGTGLNFLAAWQLFEQTAPKDACLEFISTEKYPLTTAQIRDALREFDELSTQLDAFLEHYPVCYEGHHFLPIIPGRIHLHLLIGDACEQLKELVTTADAWFLDGFAPAKNPEMWSEALFKEIAKLSGPATTFATFTASSHVQKTLKQVGFDIKKDKGFGRKREMLFGLYKKDTQCKIDPWYRININCDKNTNIAILGVGIAGCTTAWVLAKSGYSVTLIDQYEQPAQAASGNPAGLIRPLLTGDNSLPDQMITQSALLTLRAITQFEKNGAEISFSQHGIIQTAHNPRLQKRYRTICEKRQLPFCKLLEQAPYGISEEAYHITAARQVNPPALCKAFLKDCHDKIQYCQAHISSITRDNDQWHCHHPEGTHTTDLLIITAGAMATKLDVCKDFPIKSTPGQISLVSAPNHGIKQGLCYEGYCLPMGQNTLLLGATYRQDDSSAVLETDHEENVAALSKILPDLADRLRFADKHGRVSNRCATPDHLPLVGAAISKNNFYEIYNSLIHGDKRSIYPDLPHLDNLLVNIGHGSKGLSTALLSAYLIASIISKNTLPMPVSVYRALHAQRFCHRHCKTFR